MAFCKNCGNQLADGAAFCSNCGTAQNAAPVQNTNAPAPVDNGGFWWGVLGCCVGVEGRPPPLTELAPASLLILPWGSDHSPGFTSSNSVLSTHGANSSQPCLW